MSPSKHPINARILHKSVFVRSSLDQVWWKWATHAGLATFFGADNLIDLRPGGPFEIYFLMENPIGLRGGEGNLVLSYLPQKMLSFSWNAPPTIPEVRDHEHKTWVVIQLEQRSPNTIQVALDHLGWLDGPAWDEAYEYFNNAWDIVLKSLTESCQG